MAEMKPLGHSPWYPYILRHLGAESSEAAPLPHSSTDIASGLLRRRIKHIFIICGEASGDLHAGNLAKRILEINPEIRISGIGGAFMRQSGAKIYCDIKDLAVIGFFDVLKKLPKFLALKKLILQNLKEEKPDAIILVDFSGFNLRLAKKINKAIPVIYYVSPQVWASRPGRVKTIKSYIHKMLVLFKFEEEFYKRYGIDATFVGHPLLDTVGPTMEEKEFLNKFGLLESKTTITLLPGSRKEEIKNILPIMLKSSALIHQKIKDAQFVLAKSPQLDLDIYNRIISRANIDLKEISEKPLILSQRPLDCHQILERLHRFLSSSFNLWNLLFSAFAFIKLRRIHRSTKCVGGNLRNHKNRLFQSSLKIIEGKTYDCLNIADFCLVASGTATLETAIMQKPFAVIYKMNLLNYLLYRPLVQVPYIGMVNIVAGRRIVPEFIQFKARPEKISEQVLKILQNPTRIEQMKNDLGQVKSLLGEKGASHAVAQIILDFLMSA